MLRSFSRLIQVLLLGGLFLSSQLPLWSQSALSEAGIGDDSGFLVELETYVKYGGNIDVIDGMTGLGIFASMLKPYLGNGERLPNGKSIFELGIALNA